jgi:hypothetical protein
MLAVGNGDLWLMSTPNGKRGFFYECWAHDAVDEWFRVSVPATECARISPEFLEAERRAVGPVWFGQEFMGSLWITGRRLSGRIWWRRLWMMVSLLWICEKDGRARAPGAAQGSRPTGGW